MKTTDYITTLPEAERQALAVCGVYKQEQLMRVSAETLSAEMSQAAEFFPDKIRPISLERLRLIYQLAHVETEAESNAVKLEDSPAEVVSPIIPPKNNRMEESDDEIIRNMPTLAIKKRVSRSRKLNQNQSEIDLMSLKEMPDEAPQVSRIYRKNNAICNTRPVRTYFSALLYVTMIAAIITILVLTGRLMLGIDEVVNFILFGSLIPLAILPYMFFIAKTRCPVCNMNLFTLRKYTRNRQAHEMPLLGTNLTTALHIIFFFWFHCPACGTSQKLYKKRRRNNV